MGRPPALSAEKKALIVLDILAGHSTVTQVARDYGVSPTAVANWKRRFLEAARAALASGPGTGDERPSGGLRAANAELRAALGDAQVLARVWRVSALARQAPGARRQAPSEASPQAAPRSSGLRHAAARPRRSDAR